MQITINVKIYRINTNVPDSVYIHIVTLINNFLQQSIFLSTFDEINNKQKSKISLGSGSLERE